MNEKERSEESSSSSGVQGKDKDKNAPFFSPALSCMERKNSEVITKKEAVEEGGWEGRSPTTKYNCYIIYNAFN